MIPPRNCSHALSSIETPASPNTSHMKPIVIVDALRTFTSVCIVFSAKMSTISIHSFLGTSITAIWAITLAPAFMMMGYELIKLFNMFCLTCYLAFWERVSHKYIPCALAERSLTEFTSNVPAACFTNAFSKLLSTKKSAHWVKNSSGLLER